MAADFLRFLRLGSLGVSELAITMISLFPWVKFEDEVVDGLGVLDVFGLASILDLDQSNVLDGSDKGLLGLPDSKMNSLFLAHSEDGELFPGGSTGQIPGDDHPVPEVSAGVVSWAAVKLGWSNISEDWLLFAGGEVDSFGDFVNFLSVVAEVLEGPWPWEFSLAGLTGVFEGFRILSLGKLLVGEERAAGSAP